MVNTNLLFLNHKTLSYCVLLQCKKANMRTALVRKNNKISQKIENINN
tara:strand:+ start:409 stop:552 length:144 start_codon:yes stop_codon:yes gene_type:complete